MKWYKKRNGNTIIKVHQSDTQRSLKWIIVYRFFYAHVREEQPGVYFSLQTCFNTAVGNCFVHKSHRIRRCSQSHDYLVSKKASLSPCSIPFLLAMVPSASVDYTNKQTCITLDIPNWFIGHGWSDCHSIRSKHKLPLGSCRQHVMDQQWCWPHRFDQSRDE